eukprot:gnl/MRDRNA2_/MRDRNA2_61475_c0_seq1.p1 gnl/MRDRNA2_/MRDRNA2_61475_c0~~gnl/MRDRNA2_/MRDRNA2_61475_c0_seq1.p1  ORF type:complete len:240 (+),score=22.24 gnl/MRDRNA2_/MRDRNA2_61475_c0_seq1:93-812(+)
MDDMTLLLSTSSVLIVTFWVQILSWITSCQALAHIGYALTKGPFEGTTPQVVLSRACGGWLCKVHWLGDIGAHACLAATYGRWDHGVLAAWHVLKTAVPSVQASDRIPPNAIYTTIVSDAGTFLLSALLHNTSTASFMMPVFLYAVFVMNDVFCLAKRLEVFVVEASSSLLEKFGAQMHSLKSENQKNQSEQRGRSAQPDAKSIKRDSTPKPGQKVGNSSRAAPSNSSKSSINSKGQVR